MKNSYSSLMTHAITVAALYFCLFAPLPTIAQTVNYDRPFLDGEVRAVGTDEVFFAEGKHSGKTEYNKINFEVGMYILKAKTMKAKKALEIKTGDMDYTIVLNLRCMHEMYISKGKTILFKLQNGTNMQFETLDDIDKSYDAQRLGRLSGWYRNRISFGLTRLQLQKLINGKVIKIRVVDNLTNRHDAEVNDNQFSSILSQELKLIEDRLKNNDDAEGF